MKITVKGNDRDVLNYDNNRGATEMHRTEKKFIYNNDA